MKEHAGFGAFSVPLQHSAWLVSCCIGILTTLMLMHVHHVVHSFTLLLMHVVAGLALRAAVSAMRRDRSNTYQHSNELPDHRERPFSLLRSTVHLIPSTLARIFAYVAMQPNHDPVMALMVLSLQYCPDSYTRKNNRQSTVASVVCMILQLACVLVVLRYDYRIHDTLSWEFILAILFQAIAQHAHDRSESDELPMRTSTFDSQLASAMSSIPLLAVIAVFETRVHGGLSQRRPPYLLLTINIVANALAITLRGPLGLLLHKHDARTTNNGILTSLEPNMLAGIVSAGYHCLARDSLLSTQQLAAYFIAWLCSVRGLTRDKAGAQGLTPKEYDDMELSEIDDTGMLGGLEDEEIASNGSGDTTLSDESEHVKASISGATFSLTIIVLACLAWGFLLLQALGVVPPVVSADPLAHLDPRQHNKTSLDVVVAYYDEPLEQLGNDLRDILQTKHASEVEIRRVFVYNKGVKNTLSTIKHVLNLEFLPHDVELAVLSRMNEGREAETYLGHILENWNDLSTHTIFTQATMHESNGAIRRVQDYLVPQTGFLSLSSVANLCRDCSNCHDLSRWSSGPTGMTWIWRVVNSGSSECQNVALTYKGQFIASAARIRGRRQEVYRQLRSIVIGGQSACPDRVTRGCPDLSKEDYGYLLERMWGAIMQCSSERIADRCPTLFSGRLGRLGALDDCQCFDT